MIASLPPTLISASISFNNSLISTSGNSSMAQPNTPKGDRTSFLVRLSPVLASKIDQVAKRLGIAKNEAVCVALERFVQVEDELADESPARPSRPARRPVAATASEFE